MNRLPYLYETHLHTADSSACAHTAGPDYVAQYKSLGYDGIFVTDHFWLGNTCVPRDLPWELWVQRYSDAWRRTKEAGDKIGLKVFFGWESTYGTGEDFLVYGLSPEWLTQHPEIIRLTQEEQYALVSAEGGLVVQAHPFRERYYMREVRLHPWHCDAWEVANAGNTPEQDKSALDFALAHHLTMTCGSDIHSLRWAEEGRVFPMVTEEPLQSGQDYVRLIKSGKGYTPGYPPERMDCDAVPPVLPAFLHRKDGTVTQDIYRPVSAKD